MENQEQEVKEVKQDKVSKNVLAISFAIVLAGAFIGGGLMFSGQTVADNNPLNTISAVSEDDYVRGSLDAKLQIVEFSDLECPYCKSFHQTMNQIIAEYGPTGQVSWAYRHFPLSIHPKAVKEAHAAECAGELGGNEKFWEYVDRVFEITPSNNGLDLDLLPQIAVELGLNLEQFNQCLDSGKHIEKISDQADEVMAGGGEGTPFSVIMTKGGERFAISGALSYEEMKAAIEELLK